MFKILNERGGVSTQLYTLEVSMCEDLLSTNSLTNAAGFSAASSVNAEQMATNRWRLAPNSMAFFASTANGPTKTQHGQLLSSELETR